MFECVKDIYLKCVQARCIILDTLGYGAKGMVIN